MFEDAINRVSLYAELTNAARGADFQKILNNVRSEWRWSMNIFMALCGYEDLCAQGRELADVDADEWVERDRVWFRSRVIFSVGSAAKRAVATSGVSARIGRVLNFWYQLLYNEIAAARFQVQARDTFRAYYFFCLWCRLPAFFMLMPSTALLASMFFVSFHVWSWKSSSSPSWRGCWSRYNTSCSAHIGLCLVFGG